MFTFRLSIFISAILLFQVQLIIARCILPWFGGSAAVWMACMLFFQLLLVAGYGYSHLLIHRIDSRRKQVGIHVGLLLLSCILLIWQKINWGNPLLPDARLQPETDERAILSILQILTVSAGLPFLVLSATSSLLQAWFGRVWERRSPYILYALSNTGSLLGLLSYPFLLSPFVGLRRQAMLWAAGFLVFAGACLGSALTYLRKGSGIFAEEGATGNDRLHDGLIRKLLWVLLPATGVILMMATTNVLTQNIAVIPMLWVLPLALYLLSYVIAFSERFFAPGSFSWSIAAGVALYGLLYVELLEVANLPTIKIAAPYLFAMFIACVYCHGALVRLRPGTRHLTAFYLSLSVGGALGGLFVAVLAPLLFKTILELPVGFLMCAGLVATAMWMDPKSFLHGGKKRIGRILVALYIVGLAAGLSIRYVHYDSTVLWRTRNFYGSINVWQDELIQRSSGERFPVQMLSHGETIHGIQVKHPQLEMIPASYYSPESGIGLLMRTRRDYTNHVGLVGLGVGSLAGYGRAGEIYRFYEIDHEMIRVATDPALGFTYLSKSRAEIELVPGDARLKLEHELEKGGNDFDILVLDAFTGDAIPEHLLTREAFEAYRQHLAPGGAMAVNISSRHFDLSPLLFRLAEEIDMRALKYDVIAKKGSISFSSTWIIISGNEKLLEALALMRKPARAPDDYHKVPVWTDDFSNSLQLIQMNKTRPFFDLYSSR